MVSKKEKMIKYKFKKIVCKILKSILLSIALPFLFVAFFIFLFVACIGCFMLCVSDEYINIWDE